MIDAQFAYTVPDRLEVSEMSECEAIEPGQNARSTNAIPEVAQPP